MIEDMEIKMRNSLQEVSDVTKEQAVCLTCSHNQVYFGKTRDIVYDLRSVENLERARQQKELQKELVGFIKR